MLTATGARAVLSEGFVVHGDTNQSDGLGPRYEVGCYASLEEAIAASKGKGVQGDPGTVSRFQVASYVGGLVRTEETPLIRRRQTPSGSWTVGFVDLREYEYGIREANAISPRLHDGSIFNRNPFVVEGEEAASIELKDPLELRRILRSKPTEFVGLWRKLGDHGWRGEFPGGTDEELNRWIATEQILETWCHGDEDIR